MKISKKILSIPPYISTSWKNIASISLEVKQEATNLRIVLHNGTIIDIPGLEPSIREAVFEAHAKYLEWEQEHCTQSKKSIEADALFGLGMPLRIGPGGIEALGAAMQHNPEQADTPDIPPEVLSKITGVAKILGLENIDQLPKPEPHCNCVHCQIARAFVLGVEKTEEHFSEEEVTDEDLQFRNWEIQQESDKLYVVTNRLDEREQYNVYLGETVGCTCGQPDCEHIRTVLSS